MSEHIETHRAQQHPIDIAEDYLVNPFKNGGISNGDMERIKSMIEDAIEEENR